MDTGAYQFADLQQHSELIEEISRLESRMMSELGQDVTLIAYSKGEKAYSDDRS